MFYITELIIYNSNRFTLNNIKKITYKPTRGLNLILGSNGSGKSTMLDYLTILPLDKEDFDEGGYRILRFNYKGNEYEVSTGLIGVNKHSFIKNGKELNGGYTRKVYLLLLEKEFNINQKIIDIMTLKKKFVLQSFTERGNWFNILTKNNLEYPLSTYNKLRSKARDLKGFIKLETENLNKLIASKLDDSVIENMKKDREVLSLVLNNITEYLDTDIDNIDLLSIIDKQSKQLLNNLSKINNDIPIDKRDFIDREIKDIDIMIKMKSDLLDKFIGDYSGNIDFEKEISNIETQINNGMNIFKSLFKDDININWITNMYNGLNNLYDNIHSIITELKELDNISINDNVLQSRNILEATIKELKDKLSHINIEIKMLEENSKQDDIICPSCKTAFKPNFDSSRHITLVKEKNALEGQLQASESKFKIVDDLISKVNYKNTLYEQLKQYLINCNLYGILKDKSIFEIESFINSLYSNANLFSKIKEYNEKLEVLKKDYQLVKSGLNRESIEEELNKLYEKKTKLESLLKLIDEQIVYDNNIRLLHNELIESMRGLEDYIEDEIHRKSVSELRRVQNELQTHISTLDTKLSNVAYVESKIEDINNTLKLKKLEMGVYEKTIKALSPKDGLIAESIVSLLEYLLDNMNDIINEIWEYPLEVLLPDFEEYGLKFNFLLNIDNKNIRKDISYGSEAMQEIVNLAFSIAFTKLMELDFMPLYLDEFSSSFDTIHKTKTISFINRIIDNRQCFMITHDIGQMLEGADSIVILDSNNLNVDLKSTDNILIEN
jgi:energy-coupling factor transporter ATP-binding protein EcfA2